MSPRPIAEFLISFGTNPVDIVQEVEPESIVFIQQEAVNDAVDLVDEARIQGIAEGRSSAESALVERLNEQKLLYEKQLDEERVAWTRNVVDSINQQIKAAIEDVETSLSESVNRILRPFVTKAILDKVVSELCKFVSDLVCDKEASFLEIKAPENLLDELRKKLALYQSIKFVQSDSWEVTAITNDVIFETQLATWLDKISLLPE